MRDEDKEAFERWKENASATRDEIQKFEAMTEHEKIQYCIELAWQAACEYKQKEIDELEESLATRLAKCYIAGKDLSKTIQNNLINEVQKLQAENAKLRECVEFYADAANNPTQYMRQGYLVYNLKKKIFVDGGELARQVLKELNEKL